jgi:dolichol kinase
VSSWIAPGDLRGALILSAIFLSLLATAELWRRFGNPEAEWTRKLVHLGGGIACLFFPFLVTSPWVVTALALSLTALFALGGHYGFLKGLHGIGRKSRGAEYYPLSVCLVFWITQGRPWLYLSAVLVLAVADAFAALVGSRYGVVRFEVEDETKSLEGSLVFLLIAFLAIHLPALLMTDLPRPVTVLAALLVAALVTGFEAVSLQGADNLFVPLAVVVVLGKITTKPTSEVVFQNLSLLGICLAVALIVWRSRSLNVGGAITFILFAYGLWSLGDWQWALPAFCGFATYVAGWYLAAPPGPTPGSRHASGIKVRLMTRALLIPFTPLALANSFHGYAAAYGPYLAASGAVLAFSLDTGVYRLERRQGSRALATLGLGTLAALVTAVPVWLLQDGVAPSALAAVAAAVVLATLANTAIERQDAEARRSREWTAWRFLLAAAAGVAVAALQAAGWIGLWNPA